MLGDVRWGAYLVLGLSACAGDCEPESSIPDLAAGGTGGQAVTIACPDSGVLHGPWSLHFDETSAKIRWDACAPSPTTVIIEPEAGGTETSIEGEQSASDVQTTYDVFDGVPPDLPGVYYRTEVSVTGLSPSTCYRYRIAHDALREGRFCTARESGEPVKFLAIGDTNPAVGDTQGVLDVVLGEDPDFVLHLGDIQYYASVFDSWAHWFPAMAPMLRKAAFMPSVGNHEYENDFEFADYYQRLFGGAGFDGTVEYYRFQSGGIWFFSLNTEQSLKAGSEQAQWLETQLADAASQAGFRFSVVYFHKPMMTLSKYAQKSGERAHFRPIFAEHGVKLVLTGHVHGYERFVDGDLTYIVSGGGGAALHDLDEKIATRPEEAAMRQASAERYHATLFEVLADRIEGRAISHEGEALDSFSIALP